MWGPNYTRNAITHAPFHKPTFRTTARLFGGRELWSKGYDAGAVRVCTHYAYEVLSLRPPIPESVSGNVAFLKMLLKAGY